MTDKKELLSIYNFYKDTEKGFATKMDIMRFHLKVNLWQSFIMVRYSSFVGMRNLQEIILKDKERLKDK